MYQMNMFLPYYSKSVSDYISDGNGFRTDHSPIELTSTVFFYNPNIVFYHCVERKARSVSHFSILTRDFFFYFPFPVFGIS